MLGGNSKTNDVASSGDEVKMLLQGRKQFENMTLGKAGHGVAINAVQFPSGNINSWLDEEMKSIFNGLQDPTKNLHLRGETLSIPSLNQQQIILQGVDRRRR